MATSQMGKSAPDEARRWWAAWEARGRSRGWPRTCARGARRGARWARASVRTGRRRRRGGGGAEARGRRGGERGRRIRAVRRIRCQLFDDARGQRAERRISRERAPFPLGSVVGVERAPREEDSPGGDGRRGIFRGGHGRDWKGADGGQDAPIARSQRVAETAPKSEGERSRGGGASRPRIKGLLDPEPSAAKRPASASRPASPIARRIRRRWAPPGVLRGRLRGHRRGRDGWKIAVRDRGGDARGGTHDGDARRAGEAGCSPRAG